MARRWTLLIPLAAVLLSGAFLPSDAFSAAAPAARPGAGWATPPCTFDTASVKTLFSQMDTLNGALVPTPVVSQIGPDSGDAFNDVLALQQAGCLPALPVTPPAATSIWRRTPMAASAQACLGDTVRFLSALLAAVDAANTTPADQTALKNATDGIITATSAVNTDACLPVALPVPQLPSDSGASSSVHHSPSGRH